MIGLRWRVRCSLNYLQKIKLRLRPFFILKIDFVNLDIISIM